MAKATTYRNADAIFAKYDASQAWDEFNQAVADCVTVPLAADYLPRWARRADSQRSTTLANLTARMERRALKRANEQREREILAESKAQRLKLHTMRIQAEQEHDDEFCHDIHHGQREFAYGEFAKLIGLDSEE